MLERFFAQMVSPFITAGKWALNGGKWAYEQLSKMVTACIAQLRALARHVGGRSETVEGEPPGPENAGRVDDSHETPGSGPPEPADVGGFDDVHVEEQRKQRDAGTLAERGIIDLDFL